MDQGFDEFFGFTDAVHAWEKFPTNLWEGREKKPSAGYADDLFTDRGVEFIGRNKDRPFFLYLPLISTHFHVEAPADEVAKHQGKVPEDDPSNPINANYAALVTRLDAQVGRVVSALKDAGLDDEDAHRLHERPRRHVRIREPRGERRPRQQPAVPGPEADALGGRNPGPGGRRLAGTHPGGVGLLGRDPHDGPPPDVPRHRRRITRPGLEGRRPRPVAGLERLGNEHRPSPGHCSGNGGPRGATRSRRCAGTSSSSSRPATRPELFDVTADPAERRNIAAIHPKDAISTQGGA